MGKYFTIKELCKSYTAIKRQIDNVPNKEQTSNLENLILYILDPLREAYGKPIIVDSGFRCNKLNKLVGGSTNSQHKLGQAADIRTVSDDPKENAKLFELIQSLNLPFDQLINEYDFNWVHVSYSPRHRKQILKIN